MPSIYSDAPLSVENDKLEVDVTEVETNKKGLPAFNYLDGIIEKMPLAIKSVALQPGLMSSARTVATSIRKSYVQNVGRTKKKVPPKLRSVVYRQNKRRGNLYRSIKATRGRRRNPRNPYANVRVGGPGARQAALVEYGHRGGFGPPRKIKQTSWSNYSKGKGHSQYDPHIQIPGKGFVREAFVGIDAKVVKSFERAVKRTEAKVAKEAKSLAGR